jgi:hypothetical protein
MRSCLIFLVLSFSLPLHAQKAVFSAPGNNFGVWRLTHDPHVRDWANRYNTQCFSTDGRFVCYTHYPTGENDTASVRVFDLHKDKELVVGAGFNPRWAKQNNWLIYTTYNQTKAKGGDRGAVIFLCNFFDFAVIACWNIPHLVRFPPPPAFPFLIPSISDTFW